jgi:flagellar basal-body rod protein FlgG
MLQGLFAAAAGMQAQQTQLDALANDIANADTPGYQSELVGFHDLLYASGAYNGLDKVATGTGAAAGVIGFSQAPGTIEQTGQPLDVAISGDGYLEVQQGDGTMGLTRNGTLQLNGQGQLTTDLGMPVQPPITVPPGTKPSDISIAADGTVRVGKRTLGQLDIVTVPAPDQLLPQGNGVFSATTASGAIRPATGAVLQQGALEQSNVDINQAMTSMMTAEQSYDMASKAIEFESQMGQIATTLKG